MTDAAIGPECAAVLRRISAYLDGELEVADCDAIDRHCRTCDHCASVVGGLRDAIGLCRSAGRTPVPDSVRQKARDSVAALLRERTT
jgi:anti-sigma factor RsiW